MRYVINAFIYWYFLFFNDTATTEIYTLSLHDALPICNRRRIPQALTGDRINRVKTARGRSEEHTSELQSPVHLVCSLLLEKKNNKSAGQGPRCRHGQDIDKEDAATRE